jgi:hypothetical protein
MKKYLRLLALLLALSPAVSMAALRGAVSIFNTTAGSSLTVPLQWTVSGVTAGSTTVVTLNYTSLINPIEIGSQISFASVGGINGLNGNTGSVTARGGTSGAWTVTVNLSTTGTYTSGGTATLALANGDQLVILVGGNNGGSQTFTFPSGTNTSITGCTGVQAMGGGSASQLGLLAVGATPPTSLSLSSTEATGYMSAEVRAYSGRSGTVTFCAHTYQGTAAQPITFAITGGTPGSGDDVGLLISLDSGLWTTGSLTYTPPSGWTNTGTTFNSSGQYANVLLFGNIINSSGTATGTIGGTESNGAGNTSTYSAYVISLAASGGSSCAHTGWPSSGAAAAVPNGTSGTYRLTNGTFGTPDCSTVSYIHSDGTIGVN